MTPINAWPSEAPWIFPKAQGPVSAVFLGTGRYTYDPRAEYGEDEIAWLPAAAWLDAMEEQGDWSRPVRI